MLSGSALLELQTPASLSSATPGLLLSFPLSFQLLLEVSTTICSEPCVCLQPSLPAQVTHCPVQRPPLKIRRFPPKLCSSTPVCLSSPSPQPQHEPLCILTPFKGGCSPETCAWSCLLVTPQIFIPTYHVFSLLQAHFSFSFPLIPITRKSKENYDTNILFTQHYRILTFAELKLLAHPPIPLCFLIPKGFLLF